LSFTINPPWWRTWWAYLLYGITAVFSGIFVHRYQKAKTIRQERERTRERELAQAKEIEKAYEELKATQAQLIQSEKMASLGELTAGIAHEIQNPLNFVNNFAEINTELIEELIEEIKADNKEESMAIATDLKMNEEKIMIHGKRADGIVRGMLMHSRGTGEKVPTDLNALADEYFRLAYHGLRAKDKSFNANMESEFDPKIKDVEVIPQDMGRVVLNLITNAFYAVNERKSMENGTYEPLVKLTTEMANGAIVIKVKDNGGGMPKEVLDKIFQPFFTTKPTGKGTGLGLSMSYDIVTNGHGGQLLVESKEGEGSEFIIRLPNSS
jgi:signal transduction histidine kinase